MRCADFSHGRAPAKPQADGTYDRGLAGEIEGDGLDAIVLNTSGCATAVREYEYLFRHDQKLAEKAKAVVERVRDVAEVVAELGLGEIGESSGLRIAYHDACSLQHGQHIKSEPRTLLQAAGFTVAQKCQRDTSAVAVRARIICCNRRWLKNCKSARSNI